jgi:hypothetical protein
VLSEITCTHSTVSIDNVEERIYITNIVKAFGDVFFKRRLFGFYRTPEL